MIDLNRFIQQHVIRREQSLCREDINEHHDVLSEKIRDKRMLVIGGGGTIGGAYIKACLHYHPEEVLVVDHSENNLAELTRDLRSSHQLYIPEKFTTYPFSYSSVDFEYLLKTKGPFDIVAHFAAHKHVRSEKDAYSIAAMLRNNVLDTHTLLEHLSAAPPKHFFSVSTDKATDPVNVMGASKKLMEDLIMSYSDRFKVTSARFANVAFSNGSLPDAFLRRLQKRQPLAAPRDVERYFISPEESGQICLLASVLGKSGELIFPKLARDAMMRFDEIARALLRELEYEIEECPSEEEARMKAANLSIDSIRYPVYFFETDTSGEKEFEVFYRPDDDPDFDRFHGLGVLHPQSGISSERMHAITDELSALLNRVPTDKSVLIDRLQHWIPTFQHHDTGKLLDDRM